MIDLLYFLKLWYYHTGHVPDLDETDSAGHNRIPSFSEKELRNVHENLPAFLGSSMDEDHEETKWHAAEASPIQQSSP